MGTIKKGIIGPFRGKAGSIIGSSWRKINYIKGLPRKKDRKPTPGQAEVRLKFALLNHFLDPLSELLESSFGPLTARATGRNAAFSYNYDHAFVSNEQGVQLNYPGLRFSHGYLVTAGDERAWIQGDQLYASWHPGTYGMGGEPDDRAIVLVYDVETRTFVPATEATRQDGIAHTLDRGTPLKRSTMHVWLFFIDKSGKRASKTVYIPIADTMEE